MVCSSHRFLRLLPQIALLELLAMEAAEIQEPSGMEVLVKNSFCIAPHRSILPSVQKLLLIISRPRRQP